MPTAVITGQMFQLDPADSSHIFDFSTFESIWRNGYLIVFHSCKNPIDCGQKYFQGKIVFTICGSNVIASFKYRRKQLSNVHIMDDMVSDFGFWMKVLLFDPGFWLKVIKFSFIPAIHSFIAIPTHRCEISEYLNEIPQIPQIRTKPQMKTWSAVTIIILICTHCTSWVGQAFCFYSVYVLSRLHTLLTL